MAKPPALAGPRCRLDVKLQPGASRNAVVAKTSGEWKLAVTAPPVDGRANEACIRLLSAVLSVPRAAVTLLRGQTNRKKLFEIEGLSAEEAEARLGSYTKA